ncbi:serine hydrolase [Fictibacillus sp. B-59209]|uniref:serine hydrolase domain-containing protein n=1 Tax=Fictibacillus sp. B-59209 TaxID=3024873 RepID=UPI002E1E323C|nr:serine hydrolase [Fictibacillus sp. B-59209]
MIEEALRFLEREIEKGAIPGAVLYVSHKKKEIIKAALGHRSIFPEVQPMTLSTVFDLASLTKVVATLPAILKLIDQKVIQLSDPVSYFLPAFTSQGKESVKLLHLLTHTSGLPPHKEYYLQNLKREEVIDQACKEELVAPPGTKVIYSDLGFMLLHRIVEFVVNETFPEFVHHHIFQPLGMNHTGFCPRFPQERYAATEFDAKRNTYKSGIVHDDNAESMGGISGHAGLFSTIDDLKQFADMIQYDGAYLGSQILSSKAVQQSRKDYTPESLERRGLGWILQSRGPSSCGRYFSSDSYGHTGFTGTSMWFDPTIELCVILLTNRVHFGRNEEIHRIRPTVHDLIRKQMQ